jgi:hypothetical protein
MVAAAEEVTLQLRMQMLPQELPTLEAVAAAPHILEQVEVGEVE